MTLISLLLLPHIWAGESARPVVKFAVAPKYPTLTLEGRVSGVVTVRVTIDRSGVVKSAKVIEGHPMLAEAASDAARQWTFQNGTSDKREVTLKFSFVILAATSEIRSQTIFLPPTGIEIRQRPEEPEMEDQGGEFTVVEHPISMT